MAENSIQDMNSVVSSIPLGARIISKVARALTGREVISCILDHLKEIAKAQPPGLTNDQIGAFLFVANNKLEIQSRLRAEHLTYPKVAWKVEMTVEEDPSVEPRTINIYATTILQLAPTEEISLILGTPKGLPKSITVSGEQESSEFPDTIRSAHNLGTMVTIKMLDGSVRNVSLPIARRSIEVNEHKTGHIAPPPAAIARPVTIGELREEELLAEPTTIAPERPVITEPTKPAAPRKKSGVILKK